MYKPKVLIVDDIQENIDALITILEELETEIEIISCNNGNDAVTQAMQHDFALMLLDVQMPGMDGFEALEYIRKEEKNKVVPALFLSAVYTSEVFQQKGVETGAVDFIIKPINPDILLGKVKLFLEIHEYKYKLVTREALINATLEATADGVMVLNSETKISHWNNQFLEMLEMNYKSKPETDSEEVKSDILKVVKTPTDFEKYFDTDSDEFIKKRKKQVVELHNGKIFNLKVKPQYAFNKVTGYVFTFSDITDLKQLERKIETKSQELSAAHAAMEEVTFKTTLLNTKLVESEKKLMELNANKDKFFSIVSHDLKSPFSSLMGITELLHGEYDGLDDETRKTWIASMNNQTQNIYNLLESLLEWAKTQTGRMEFNPEKFDIFNLVDDLFDLFGSNAANKEIKLVNEIDEDLRLFGDVNMNMTVLRNLISNAIKFTPKGGEIRVWTEETETEHKISVSDSGVGMDQMTVDNLFKIEVYNTTLGTEEEKGTGVGLILCDEFVKKHKGKIYAESEIDKGSVFTYTIPKEMEKAEA